MRCGVLADGNSFPILNANTKNQARRKICHYCQNLKKKEDRERLGIGVPISRPPEAKQTNKRQRWSKQDDDYLRDHVGGTSYEDIAVYLGRSLRAVYKRRDILGISSVRKRQRVEKPWKIELEG